MAVTLLFTALAAASGRDAVGAALVAAAVATGQLSVGWLNDLVDAPRDRLTGRTDKPVAAGAVSPRAVGVAVGVAALACVPLSLASGPVPGLVHLLAVAAGWAYDLGLKSSPASLLTYLVGLALAPAFVVLGLPGSPPPPWWLPAVTALLGGGLHFANVLRDLDDDLATGVRGLPQRLGTPTSRVLAVLLVLAAVTLLAAAAPLPLGLRWAAPPLAGLVLAVGFRAGRAPRSMAPFRAVALVAVLTVGLLLSLGPALRG